MTKRSGKRPPVDAHGLKNPRLLWMLRRVVLVGTVVFTLLVTACARQPWPVPVPEGVDVAGQPKRLELRLPVVSPPTCREITLQAFLRQPSRCPHFEQLKAFLEMHAARFIPVGRPAFVVDEDLWALMHALDSEQALSEAPFPKKVPTLPERIRELHTWRAIDSRDRTPPQGRPTVALLYRCFWWTFWQKDPAPPPPPDAGVDPKLRPPFDRLIVFPEFPERIARGTDAC